MQKVITITLNIKTLNSNANGWRVTEFKELDSYLEKNYIIKETITHGNDIALIHTFILEKKN